MQYPTLTPENVSRDYIDVFGGYNHNPRINDNEFFDMKNMTSSSYPMIATRPRRGTVSNEIKPSVGSICGALYRSAFYAVSYTSSTTPHYLNVYKNGTKIAEFNTAEGIVDENVPRNLVMMGAYLLIFPDKLYVNVEGPTDKGSIENEVTAAANFIAVLPCLSDGTAADIDYIGKTAPTNYSDNYVWVDTSYDPPVTKRYVENEDVWMDVVYQYISFIAAVTEIAVGFKEGDAIKIEGAPYDLDGVSIIRKLTNDPKKIIISGQLENTELKILTPIQPQIQKQYQPSGSQTTYWKTRVLCDNKIEENEFQHKYIVYGNQKIACAENTAAVPYLFYEKRNLPITSQRSYLTTINQKQTWSSAGPFYKFKVSLDTYEGIFDTVEAEESVVVNGTTYPAIYVRIGEKEDNSYVCLMRHHVATGMEADDEIALMPFNTPVPFASGIPANTKIYPVEKGESDLYETTISLPEKIDLTDKLCAYPDYMRTSSNAITFSRKMPVMDTNNIIESKNRLWGCHYGVNADGEQVNEIYSSNLGDFKNWQCYEGRVSDSYAVSVGTDGAWTGAVDYLGYPTFFKDNYIHTVYGSYPAQYQVNSIVARGVQAGSSKSIAILKETLFYMSRDGVCTYDGSLPSNISYEFGDQRYHDAVACAWNGRYFICFKDASNNPLLMVYDSNRGVWHKEDALNALEFCPVADDIYYITSGTGYDLRSLFGSGGQETTPVPWFVETGWFGLSQADKKYISRLNVRLSLERGSNAIISIQYDNSGVWERLCNVMRRDINPFTVPIKPKRCDHFKLRFEGNGKAIIYSIAKTIAQGSDK